MRWDPDHSLSGCSVSDNLFSSQRALWLCLAFYSGCCRSLVVIVVLKDRLAVGELCFYAACSTCADEYRQGMDRMGLCNRCTVVMLYILLWWYSGPAGLVGKVQQ